ncbi:MAG: helix-turn-helix domain-containing protein [Bacteroidales bacterium]|nr:helix-turn-helix domain-containing protein [Bacteroidales bacterium]MCM1148029.1 helix-turn-helix domain-containing protein [Bacteroidales bacterium]MCM1206846.1 helix-turn-helix domain-containing protein [Bacillota bacterium]MCM1511015.1 helix-turn-helix domain-containing protein [Clostridium sp.]
MSRLLFLLFTLLSCNAFGMQEDSFVTDNLDGISDISHQHVTQILQDRRGFLWLSSWNGLYRFDGYDFVAFKAKPGDGNDMNSDRFRNIVLDYEVTPGTASGNIYCLVDYDVFLFNVRTSRFIPVTGNTANKARQVFKQHGSRCGDFTDNRGIRWQVTENGFLRKTRHIRKWQRINGVSPSIVRVLHRDRKGNIWFGTKDGRLAMFTPAMQLAGYMGADGRLHSSPTDFLPVYCMCDDSRGTLWIGTKPHGLFRLQGQSLEKIDGISSPDIYDLKEDRAGRIWVATHVGGISIVTPAKKTSGSGQRPTVTAVKATDGLRVRRLLILDDGTMLATTTKGLLVADNIYKPTEKIRWCMHAREARRKESLSDNATMNVIRDKKGRIFVTTESGGLNQLLTTDLHAGKFSFKHYNTENGMGTDVTMACISLPDGKLLIQCNNMVATLDPELHHIENYSKSFWGESLLFSDAEPIVLDKDRLILSLHTGALTVPSGALLKAEYTPPIVLTQLRTADMPADYAIEYSDTINISPSQRDFSLTFAALDLTGNRYIRYSTKLDNDSIWSHPTTANSIDFRDMDAGTHTLTIRSTNALGQWTDNVRKVTIIVEPTFFETWYGKLLVSAVIAICIALITYAAFYVRNLEKRRKETLEAYLQLLEHKNKTDNTEQIQEDKPHEPIVIAPRLSEEDEAFMHKLTDFIEKNISNSDISINDIAAATAVSRSGLNRKMRQLLGVTPADFLKEARMKRAVKLLKETTKPVSEIAYLCGFSDPKYFAKCIKASTGKTPRELRD